MTASLPPPPVPQKLREMLKDYPEHIERLQDVLNQYVQKPFLLMPFDGAIWSLEGRLETFISETREELQIAEACGDAVATAKADRKLDLMLSARSSGQGMMDLSELLGYFDANKKAFA